MSRVEDDRQAQKAAERLVQEKRLQESKTKQRTEGENAFSKLVQQQKSQQAQTQQTRTQDQGLGKSVLASLLKENDAKGKTEQRGEAQKSTLRQTGKALDERVQQSRSGEGERLSQGRQTDSSQTSQSAQGRQMDQGVVHTRAESRLADAKNTDDALNERGEALTKGSENSAAGQAGRSKGSLKTDADGGGKGGGDGKDKKDGGAELAAGFRFNPALMAPVPVAKPKPTAGSERLRAIANEIAQKIVERVRVGTNAAGNAEFQIDLRSDVLSGLSIKLSAKNGKIHAVFSGGDRDVLKMLEEQREGLKNALAGRGLTLEDLRIEAKS
ncbi:flagellar hook-length control protein FliK [Archangium violaceum]|uniref:flagellar hook-length control protein FliK n=1 Tax=Archangium violaceum TaxID=83451 RepID=UPI00194E4496|nr:flagellar hook-length control protein FliK [Archangium violaceum]QRO00410.1 flagellar hook-length control protein FliK [Archangium violaceum]